MLAKMDDRLARQDEILAKQDEHLARQDAILERQAQILAQQNQILLQMNASVERVAQHTAHLGQMAAEHTLLFERTMAILDRIEHRLDARL